MSREGEVISDARSFLSSSSPSSKTVFLVTGKKGVGKTTTLRSVRKLLKVQWGIETVQLEPSVFHQGEPPNGEVFMIDDVAVMDYLCRIGNVTSAVLEGFFGTLMKRDERTLLLCSVRSETELPLWFTKSIPSYHTYDITPPDESGSRRFLKQRGLKDEDVQSLAGLSLTRQQLSAYAAWLTRPVRVDSSETSGKWLCEAPPESYATERMQRNLPGEELVPFQEEKLQQLLLLVRIHVQRHSGDGFHPGPVAAAVAPSTGILLVGPSGCGKSCLIQLLRNSLPGVTFLQVQASRMFSKYFGESEQRLRQVFSEGRAMQPCVLVIEEIDAIAMTRKNREEGGGASTDVNTRMLSALLCEMDGVVDNTGVLVIATTNRTAVLDPALLRQGRLETVVEVPQPSLFQLRALVDKKLSHWDIKNKEQVASLITQRFKGQTPAALSNFFVRLLHRSSKENAGASDPCQGLSLDSVRAELEALA